MRAIILIAAHSKSIGIITIITVVASVLGIISFFQNRSKK